MGNTVNCSFVSGSELVYFQSSEWGEGERKGHRAHTVRKHISEANTHSTLGLAIFLVKKETPLGGFSVEAIVNSLLEPRLFGTYSAESVLEKL